MACWKPWCRSIPARAISACTSREFPCPRLRIGAGHREPLAGAGGDALTSSGQDRQAVKRLSGSGEAVGDGDGRAGAGDGRAEREPRVGEVGLVLPLIAEAREGGTG